ncbi:MAG: GntR family transcriptional regulator [Marmoricola sp.]
MRTEGGGHVAEEAKPDQRLKHVQVREYVRTLVHQSEPGSPAPSERDLVHMFGVARMTVRHALDSLVTQGLLERIPGRGTFVAKPHVDMQARLSSFSEEMERRGRLAGSRTLMRRRETAGPGVARALQVEEGHGIAHWQRLRTSDSASACISDTYVSLELFPDFLVRAEPASLYQWFGEQQLMPTWGEDSVMADSASDTEAALLAIAPDDPVLRISRRAFCREVVCEVSRSVYRADQFTLWVPVLRAEFER